MSILIFDTFICTWALTGPAAATSVMMVKHPAHHPIPAANQMVKFSGKIKLWEGEFGRTSKYGKTSQQVVINDQLTIFVAWQLIVTLAGQHSQFLQCFSMRGRANTNLWNIEAWMGFQFFWGLATIGERFREVYSISSYLFCVIQYAIYSIRLRPTIPKPGTIGPPAIAPSQKSLWRVPGGANEPGAE